MWHVLIPRHRGHANSPHTAYTGRVILGLAQAAQNNITEGATLYSTLASVLSGFAFTAIVLLVTAWLSDSMGARRVLASIGSALVASFFGLLVMSVFYAAESTNTSNNGFTVSENTILGAGFAGVGVLLLYTVVLMLDAADKAPRRRTGEPQADRARKTPAAAAPPTADGTPAGAGQAVPRLWEVARFARAGACVLNMLIVGIGFNSIGLYESYKYGPGSSYTAIDVLAWALLAIELIVVVWAVWLIIARPRDTARTPSGFISERLLICAGLGLPVASGAGYVIADTIVPDNGIIPAFTAVIVLVTEFLITAGGTIHLALTRPEPTEAEPDDSPPGGSTGRPEQSRVRIILDALAGGRSAS